MALKKEERTKFQRQINNNKAKKKTDNYIVNLESFADADSDEGFGAQSLNGERDAARYVSNGSVRFEYSHSAERAGKERE